MKAERVVLDASVLISAALRRDGRSRAVVDAVREARGVLLLLRATVNFPFVATKTAHTAVWRSLAPRSTLLGRQRAGSVKTAWGRSGRGRPVPAPGTTCAVRRSHGLCSAVWRSDRGRFLRRHLRRSASASTATIARPTCAAPPKRRPLRPHRLKRSETAPSGPKAPKNSQLSLFF